MLVLPMCRIRDNEFEYLIKMNLEFAKKNFSIENRISLLTKLSPLLDINDVSLTIFRLHKKGYFNYLLNNLFIMRIYNK